MDYVIETFGLTKSFSDMWGREKVLAVDSLDLRIKKNEVFGLLGPNGSGKTTTIKMLLGLLNPTAGNSLILGGRSSDPKISSHVGFLPEESYLYRYLSARETLDFYGRLFALPAKVRKARIEALLDMVGLKAVANRAVGTFSKGMARRIGLAQALINDPEVLILDEPTTGLDPLGTRQIKDVILKLKERGKTILLCSHLLADVEDVCDRIAILYGGRIQSQGEVQQLLRQADKRQITTGPVTEETLEKIKQIIAADSSEFEVSSPMEKLETFFIKTVSDAQKQQRKTSGAINSAKIGDFLAAGAVPQKQDNILDKLVSKSKPKSKQEETAETQKTKDTKETTQQPEPDRELLGRLTHKDKEAEPDQVTKKTNARREKQSEPEKKEPNKDILQQLTNPGDKTKQRKDKDSESNE